MSIKCIKNLKWKFKDDVACSFYLDKQNENKDFLLCIVYVAFVGDNILKSPCWKFIPMTILKP